MDDLINYLKGRTILILGLGKEGQSTYHFIRRFLPHKTLLIADRRNLNELSSSLQKKIIHDKFLKTYFGASYLSSINNCDLLIKTPGIRPPILKHQHSQQKEVILTSQTNLFFRFCPGTIIGVTGTKGKSTTTSVIYWILKSAGKSTYLIGNIGDPALPYLERADKKTYFAYELSSHQLMQLNTSPHFAVLLNIYHEHLDYYKNINEYKMAKARITLFQNKHDYLIYRFSDPNVYQISKLSKAKTIPFNLKSTNKERCYVRDNWIVFNHNKKEELIMPVSEVPLLGTFNLFNIMPGIIIARLLNIPIGQIRKAINNFKALDYRLECVGNYKRITFYNDTLATIPEATIAALETLGPKVETIILGGFDRGIDYNDFAKYLVKTDIKNFVFFPQTGKRLSEAINKYKRNKKIFFYFVNSMEKAIRLIFKHTARGKICLHSPAAPACGYGFKDYKERGERYKKAIQKFSN